MATVEVISIEDRQVTMSIRRLADTFEMARDTVAKRLQMHGVQPCGRRHGHPVFRLRDAAHALVGTAGTDADGNLDPRYLPPQQRNSWYQSEQRRLDVEMSTGQLVPAAQHEADLADMVKDLTQFCATLPDVLERDAGLTPDQVNAMIESIDRQRAALYERMIADAGESDTAEVS